VHPLSLVFSKLICHSYIFEALLDLVIHMELGPSSMANVTFFCDALASSAFFFARSTGDIVEHVKLFGSTQS
jgi:hypothetical protein